MSKVAVYCTERKLLTNLFVQQDRKTAGMKVLEPRKVVNLRIDNNPLETTNFPVSHLLNHTGDTEGRAKT